jgi:L-threonylcarbamoyladenylate synthase
MMTYSAETRVLTVDPAHPDASAVAAAAAVIRAGGLVAFPTETVYGLGANALDAAAVRRVFAAKGRPSSDPLIAHVADEGQVAQVAASLPDVARELARRFWPGPLTLVLARHPRVPPEVAAGGATVAVRVPDHPVALALLAAAGVPIVAPSANLFSRPSPTTATHVLEDLRGRVDLVLDAGPTAIGVESTVVDLTAEPPALLRPGGVPLEALRELLPALGYVPRYLEPGPGANAPSPGMLLKHYSPRAALTLYAGSQAAALIRMAEEAARHAAEGRSVGIMAFDEDRAALGDSKAVVATLGSETAPETAAARLFAVMRELDAAGVDVILARAPEQTGLGLAVWDRLVRAAEGRVVSVT